jgi:hypothetical protein
MRAGEPRRERLRRNSLTVLARCVLQRRGRALYLVLRFSSRARHW